MAVFFPVAQAGWTDLAVRTPHGYKDVQVKTTASENGTVRVRGLGFDDGIEPEDRYDILAVVNKHRLWLIPAAVLRGKRDISIHPQKMNDPYQRFRKR